MSMAQTLALRGSDGVWIISGPPNAGKEKKFNDELSANKVMVFSRDGSLFAYCNGMEVSILNTTDFSEVCTLDRPRTSEMQFSPCSTVLATWEAYTVDREAQAGNPNLFLFDIKTGNLLRSFIQKKQTNWAPQWSDDGLVCARNVSNELQFYENHQFDTVKVKLQLQKVCDYSIALCKPPYRVSAYVPGVKGQPSFVRVYQYPNFAGPNSAIANKSFYKADSVVMKWNKAGTGLVIITSCDVSEQSYYGEQGLHFISVKDRDSCLVPLAKRGPIYHVEWSPKSAEFCVVYGYMPAKVTLFNMKCEPTFDFGTGPRNCSYFNSHGNILCLAGFGNLRGNLEFWDIYKKRLVSHLEAPDSTYFQWSPDGEHIVTATTAPRLRVGNGYTVWHYCGKVLEKVDISGELWQVAWQLAPEGKFREKPAINKPVEGAALPAERAETASVYRPPQAQGMAASQKLHVYEQPSNMKPTAGQQDGKVSKNKKKKDAKKAKKAKDTEEDGDQGATTNSVTNEESTSRQFEPIASTGDPEKDKRMRNLRKKLQQIEKMKEQQSAGKKLELNQLEKLKGEQQLLDELEDLELG